MNRVSFKNNQKGVTLLELILAISIGLVIIAGALSFFVSNQQTYRLQKAVSSIQSNGQYIVSTLTSDLRMAGYGGCYPDLSSGVENLLNDQTDLGWNLSAPVLGYNNVTTSASIGGITGMTADSDVLVLKSMGQTADLAVDSDTNTIKIDNDNTAFSDGQILLVTDCINASLFQVDSVTPAASTTTLTHTLAVMIPGNTTDTMNNRFSTDAEVAPLVTLMYYLAEGKNGHSALHLAQLGVTGGTTVTIDALEIIPDIRNMQFVYGVDTNGDLDVDQYQDASAVSDWSRVISVRVALLVVSDSDFITSKKSSYSFDTSGFTFTKDSTATTGADRRMKRVFVGSSAIRNRIN